MILGGVTKLNLIPSSLRPTVRVNETDSGCELQFRIYNGTVPYNVPEGITATVRGTKGDGNGYAAEATTQTGSNLVVVTLTEQMTAVAGIHNIFEIVFADSNGLRVGTANFVLAVEKAALNGDTVISDSDIAYAEQVLNQLQSVASVNAQVQQNKADIASEASARASADATLQTEIDQIIAPSGEAPSAAEVQNARTGADGTVYPTLGDAIRTQNSDLKSALSRLDDNFAWMDIEWEQGSISKTTGEDETNSYFVRSDFFSISENTILLDPALKYAITILVYKQDGTFESATSDYKVLASQSYVNKKIRFRVRKEPIATVTPSTIGQILIYKSFNGIEKPYVTPEMYGATGTNADEDTAAWKSLLLQSKPIVCTSGKTYFINEKLIDEVGHTIVMNDSSLFGTSNITSGEYVLTLDIPNTKRDIFSYQVNINGNKTLNGLNVLNSIGNRYILSIVDCLTGAKFSSSGSIYENVITVRARFNSYAGNYALIMEKPDNIIDLVTSTNYEVCVSNTGENHYGVVHPWLWTEAAYKWSTSTCFIENAQTLGAVIDFIYADTMRYGVKINNGGHVKITNYFFVVSTNAIPATTVEGAKHTVYSTDDTAGALWIHHLQTYHPSSYIALFSPYSIRQSMNIDICDAYSLLSGSGIAALIVPCRVTNSWTCFTSLPTEIQTAYTSDYILLRPVKYGTGILRFECMYNNVDKIFYSTNLNPSASDWKSVSLQ